MIDFVDVSFEYEPGKKALNNISVKIEKGEKVGLIGANGAGKSTFFKALLGLVNYKGIVLVGDVPVSKENLKEIRKKVGYVLQNSDNQMFMPTVFEDIVFAPLNYGLGKKEAEERADNILKKLGIEDLKHRHNHKLSGGEKRMAAIATVLAMNPEVILMDEPSSALDPYNRRQVINVIRSLDNTCIIASHDLDMILDTCDKVILLNKGGVVVTGTCEEVLKDADLLEKNRLELPLSYRAFGKYY